MNIGIKQILVEILETLQKQRLEAKDILSLDEASVYLNRSKSSLYKLTFTRQISHYIPSGKMIYFKKKELDEWIIANKVNTREEIVNDTFNKLKK